MNYVPHPADTDRIKLSADLQEAVEEVSRNIHEVWASQRIDEGWSYGGERDDLKKTHPCLIEYDKLPESEKAVDRATVTQTIKMLLMLGYKIEKRD